MFLGSALTAFLGFIINQRELDLQEIESTSRLRLTEQDNLSNYFEYTMEGDVYDRLKLSAFFSTVVEDDSARSRWNQYNKLLVTHLEDYAQIKFHLDSLEVLREESNEYSSEIEKQYAIVKERYDRLDKYLDPVKSISTVSKNTLEIQKDFFNPKSQAFSITESIDNTPISKLLLERFYSADDYTYGRLYDITGGSKKIICYTLEDQIRNDVKGETTIPKGTYHIKLRNEGGMNERYKRTQSDIHKGILHITNVPDFNFVFIQIGMTNNDTSGSILVGSAHVPLKS